MKTTGIVHRIDDPLNGDLLERLEALVRGE